MKQLLFLVLLGVDPCKSFGPTMDRVASSGIPLSKINIDYDATSPAKYSIKSVPTVVLTENGQEVKRFVGVKSFQEVINFYNG
tara:strand:+ start:258 stop:506 length:249 start_codon:yes stop_codon:yes gene_type:complete